MGKISGRATATITSSPWGKEEETGSPKSPTVGMPPTRANKLCAQRQPCGRAHGQRLQGARQGGELPLLPFACLAQQRRMIFAVSTLPITESLQFSMINGFHLGEAENENSGGVCGCG